MTTEPLDLEPIKAREQRFDNWVTDVDDLIEEVERLRSRLEYIVLVADRYIEFPLATQHPAILHPIAAHHVRRLADGTSTTLPENDPGALERFAQQTAQLKESLHVATQ